jgi:hypothetical protein
MINKLKEYNGHHTMKKASPRPFVDDEAELNNYLEKNRYGGEGNHYNKDRAMPNPNRTRFTKFEENMNEDNVRPQVEKDVERFLTAILKKYKDNGYTEASIAQIVDQSLTRMKRRNMDEIDEGNFDELKKHQKMLDDAQEFFIEKAEDLEIDRDIIGNFNQGKNNLIAAVFKANYDRTGGQIDEINLKENKMKKSDLLKDYMSSRKGTNLNEQMITHQKEAKRSVLMEGAMKQFFELFEIGRTDEEIVLDYASKGVQVPEQFVSKARGQYDGLKKMKLELEMSEKEFKNSAKDIVNNPDEQVVNSENKSISSGIYESKKTK